MTNERELLVTAMTPPPSLHRVSAVSMYPLPRLEEETESHICLSGAPTLCFRGHHQLANWLLCWLQHFKAIDLRLLVAALCQYNQDYESQEQEQENSNNHQQLTTSAIVIDRLASVQISQCVRLS